MTIGVAKSHWILATAYVKFNDWTIIKNKKCIKIIRLCCWYIMGRTLENLAELLGRHEFKF